jgi:3-deoxy-D-manno-octulosonic-acid transferase
MIFIYRIALYVYRFAAGILSLFDGKAKKFVQGRKGLLKKIAADKIATHKPIWFHCASLGEFEQARPLIDGFKQSGEKILLTFFSPSGFEHRENYKNADWVYYLPMDNQKNALQFLELTQPTAAIFAKYDLWYFYLKNLDKKKIPRYLVSAIYQEDQIYFKSIRGKLHRAMLGMFTHIYLQDRLSQNLLHQIGIHQTSVVGDTRVDSVLQRAKKVDSLPQIERFLAGKKAIILGSAYLEEVKILRDIRPELEGEKIIIAPHNIDHKNIDALRKTLAEESILYSNLMKGQEINNNVLIIDNIGTLFHCYPYGKWAFIGGAFGSGLHNTLEPAAFGLPICFGPKYQKFAEAVNMINLGVAQEINQPSDLKDLYLRLENEAVRRGLSAKIKSIMHESKGASEQIQKEVLLQI